jgi:exodeoxyribonuclease VII large subunit
MLETLNLEILSVSQLNFSVKQLLENNFATVKVIGEISNLSQPRSGHIYFSLKDETSQIRCAMFRHAANQVNFLLKDGCQVQVTAKVSLYTDRGDYQLIVNSMEDIGSGLLKQAYDKLVQKLAQEGLFQEKFKQPIPSLPRHIGVITSPTGAAIHDILTTLKRRFASIPVTIYPSQVQGAAAAKQLVQAIELASRHNKCDVIILARGGGTLEDLWLFNEEIVARAIFACKIPIVSGIGHEIDFTIADLVADKRAATPTAAAELVTPNQTDLLQQLGSAKTMLTQSMQTKIEYLYQKIDWLSKRIRHPGQIIQQQITQANIIQARLKSSMLNRLSNERNKHASLLRTLNVVNPLATLERGYSITTNAATNQVISDARQVRQDDQIKIRLHLGEISAKVC